MLRYFVRDGNTAPRQGQDQDVGLPRILRQVLGQRPPCIGPVPKPCSSVHSAPLDLLPGSRPLKEWAANEGPSVRGGSTKGETSNDPGRRLVSEVSCSPTDVIDRSIAFGPR